MSKLAPLHPILSDSLCNYNPPLHPLKRLPSLRDKALTVLMEEAVVNNNVDDLPPMLKPLRERVVTILGKEVLASLRCNFSANFNAIFQRDSLFTIHIDEACQKLIFQILLGYSFSQHELLNDESLATIFVKAATWGFTQTALDCLNHPRAENIDSKDLETALIMASQCSKTTVAALLSHPSFREIDPKCLGGALLFASSASEEAIIAFTSILNHPRSGEIDPNQVGSALQYAVHNDNETIVKAFFTFFNCQHAQDISPKDLGWALWTAATNGNTAIVTTLLMFSQAKDIPIKDLFGLSTGLGAAIHSKNEAIITPILELLISKGSPYRLGVALTTTAAFGDLGRVMAILSHPRAAEITVNEYDGLGNALWEAALGGHTAIVAALLNHPRSGELDPNGWYGLENILSKTARRGHAAIVAALLEHPLVKSISPYRLNEIRKIIIEQDKTSENVSTINRLLSQPVEDVSIPEPSMNEPTRAPVSSNQRNYVKLRQILGTIFRFLREIANKVFVFFHPLFVALSLSRRE